MKRSEVRTDAEDCRRSFGGGLPQPRFEAFAHSTEHLIIQGNPCFPKHRGEFQDFKKITDVVHLLRRVRCILDCDRDYFIRQWIVCESPDSELSENPIVAFEEGAAA